MTTSDPTAALQAVTVVDPGHRGHGLGRLVKALNLRYARGHEARLRTIDTWNASGNAHMRRINEDFGFRPAGSRRMWEVDL
jgi:GNAT superfamily N-acetyltransferase